MKLHIFPDHISIGFDRQTLALLIRIMNYVEAIDQAAIDALTQRLKASRTALGATVAANPDPNTND